MNRIVALPRTRAPLAIACALLLSLSFLPVAGCGGGGEFFTGGGGDGGGPDPSCPDSDRDGISDAVEGASTRVDTDKDGKPDYLDPDADGDTIPDRVEYGAAKPCGKPVDSDRDGVPDFRDLDSDGNKVPDRVEGALDIDGDKKGNYADWDNDGDRIDDKIEIGPDPKRPLDTDKDKTPDYNDRDADNDSIHDSFEGSNDTDKDGIPNFRDLDSDADTISDAKERGVKYPPPADTDKDGTYDFLDPDSDDDGLSDKDEVNKYKTNPRKADSDGDGVTDLVEILDPRYDPNDPKKNPKASGDFFFLMPYTKDPQPKKDTLSFSTKISQADVFFLVDTTGSMGGEITNLAASLSGIVNLVRGAIPDTGFGVARYEDFPTGSYGSRGDTPFGLLHRVMTVGTSGGLTSLTRAVGRLPPATGGFDGPEAGWEALYQTATGRGVRAGGASVPAFSPTSAPPRPVPAGEKVGTAGGAGFRKQAIPIVIWASDAPSHDPGGYSRYRFAGAASSAQALAELKKLKAKVIGVLSGYGGQALIDMERAARETGAVVTPAAFGSGASRPAGCSTSQCCTGTDGRGIAPKAGKCPLVFRINSNGSGLGVSIVQGIQAVTNFVKLDIGAVALDDTSDSVDAVKAFVKALEAHNVTSKTPVCTGGLVVVDASPAGDGIKDTFKQVQPKTPVCFNVIPKKNVTVKPADKPQLFKATIEVRGDGKVKLSSRKVFFIVPPKKVSIGPR